MMHEKNILNIVDVQNSTNDDWDKHWMCSDYATYFHSREWSEIWHTYTNGTIAPKPKTIIFSDGKKVVIPVMRQYYYGGIIKRFALTGPPFISKYGNWISKESLNEQHVELLSSFILDKYKNITWQLNPFDKNSKTIIIRSKYATRIPHTAYMVDLTQGDERINSKLKSSCRNHIKQAIKNKLTVSEGTGIDHWRTYYNIYLDTIKRWGAKTPYILDWKLFEILFYKKTSFIKLWLVWYNDIAIAGCINFYSHGKIIGWHMASLTAYLNLRPVHLLEYSMIQDGVNRNYSWYDFGTDGGNIGLRNFKKSFGPEKIMCDKILNWSPLLYYVNNLKTLFKGVRIQ